MKLTTNLVDNLRIKSEEAEVIRFSTVHRIGKTKADQPRPRPVVAKVTESKMKSAVTSRSKELKGGEEK